MPQQVEVRKVETSADFKAFFEFPWTLYKGDPNWTPPLLSMRRDLLDKKKNPAWEYMEGDYFAAWRGEQIVGTITAFVNHRHNEFHKEHIGWFGTFEVYDDQEAAAALLDTATEWVKTRGYDAIRGPQSFTSHEECGLLIDNFSRPILLMPYNFPYYAKLVESAGFQKVMDVHSFYGDLDTVQNDQALFQRLERLAKGIMKRSRVTVRPIDGKHLKSEFALFKELYNNAWEHNWGFVPMTPRELDAMVESLGQFFDSRLAFFAEADGKPAGFIMAVPDFNAVLHKVYAHPGEPELVSLVKAGWHWKVRPIINGARIPLMGVIEPYRHRGVDAVLFYHVLQALLSAKVFYCDSGWILETNDNMISIAHNFGLKIYKTYRFYEKSLLAEIAAR